VSGQPRRLLRSCSAHARRWPSPTKSRALGLDKSQFTISDRADSGVQTTFTARTKGGKTYSCYVEGSVSVVGRVVSDALCREMSKSGTPVAPAANAPSDPACNALLRAANRCK
jgi:hypothetical protein